MSLRHDPPPITHVRIALFILLFSFQRYPLGYRQLVLHAVSRRHICLPACALLSQQQNSLSISTRYSGSTAAVATVRTLPSGQPGRLVEACLFHLLMLAIILCRLRFSVIDSGLSWQFNNPFSFHFFSRFCSVQCMARRYAHKHIIRLRFLIPEPDAFPNPKIRHNTWNTCLVYFRFCRKGQ